MAGAGGGAAEGGYVRLVSADKHVFVVERRVAMVSGMIRTMLSSNTFVEGKGDIELPDIPSPVLEKVIQYFHYKVKFSGSKVPIPEFHVPPELALHVLIAADYLEC